MSSNVPLNNVDNLLAKDAYALKRVEEVFASGHKIFMCGQQTSMSFDIFNELNKSLAWMINAALTAEPAFNIKEQVAEWRDFPRFVLKTPVFGPKITGAAVRLTHKLAALGATKSLLCKQADFALNDVFVNKKLSKILRVAEEAELRGWLTIGANIREFVDLAKMCRSSTTILTVPENERSAYPVINDMDDWKAFLKSANIADNWIDLLHFNDVAKLFGATAEQCEILRKINIVPADEPKGIKAENLDDFGLRMLSKMVGMMSCDMCLTDYVILAVFYASGGNMPTTESQVVECIDLLTRKIDNEEFVKSLPTLHYMLCDAEGDDEHARMLLQYVNSVKGQSTSVFVQLPLDPKFNALEARYKAARCETFRDPDSRNGEAIIRLYGAM